MRGYVTLLVLVSALSGCAGFERNRDPASSPPSDDVYRYYGRDYLADFTFGQYAGKTAKDESCLGSIREGQELLNVFGKNPLYRGMVVPDALVIDGLLKRQALVFSLDLSVGQEGTGGLMSPHETTDSSGRPLASDFLHTNNRIIFGVMPLPEDFDWTGVDKKALMAKTIVVAKGPSLCGVTGNYDSLAKATVKPEADGVRITLNCGGEKYAQDVVWEGFFRLSKELKYKYLLESYEYRSSVGLLVKRPVGDYRSVQKKEELIRLGCGSMKKVSGM